MPPSNDGPISTDVTDDFDINNPPFNLTPLDRQVLSTPPSEFQPHTWANLQELLSTNRLDLLVRDPISLRRYLSWTSQIKRKYGSMMQYVLTERLHWTPRVPLSTPGNTTALLAANEPLPPLFETSHPTTPLADPADYKILKNDWPYALEQGTFHVIVWSKHEIESEPVEGQLTPAGRKLIEDFVETTFRVPVGEEKEGEKVLWFRNWTGLRSVRGVEHIHVLVRGVSDEIMAGWMN